MFPEVKRTPKQTAEQRPPSSFLFPGSSLFNFFGHLFRFHDLGGISPQIAAALYVHRLFHQLAILLFQFLYRIFFEQSEHIDLILGDATERPLFCSRFSATLHSNQRQMVKGKILNDPVYGFINVPYGLLFQLAEHPWFQRLRRIKQMSLAHYVYPGALHTRFHHALGALHLMTEAVEVLRGKGVDISPEEAEGVQVAILLHDIGHGPFSHTLEHSLINVSHETLSLLFMEALDETFNGRLTLARRIFDGSHPKHFLHQLVSGQVDMDRMDYLNRDSFFTGVHEGVIGYDRIIKMLDVRDNELVVEEKGIYSVEKFLIARRLMYWQAYLHKTVLSAEQMLVKTILRARQLTRSGHEVEAPRPLAFFLKNELTPEHFSQNREELLGNFALLDDHDVMSALKAWAFSNDPLLAYLSQGILHRRLYKLELSNEPFDPAYVNSIRHCVERWNPFGAEALPYLIFQGEEKNSAYDTSKDEVKILHKNGAVLPMSMSADYGIQSKLVTKYYLCYPKESVAGLEG